MNKLYVIIRKLRFLLLDCFVLIARRKLILKVNRVKKANFFVGVELQSFVLSERGITFVLCVIL